MANGFAIIIIAIINIIVLIIIDSVFLLMPKVFSKI